MAQIDRRYLVGAVLLLLLCFGLGYKYGAYTEHKKTVLVQRMAAKRDDAPVRKTIDKGYAYVVGEVQNPGVVEFNSGDRVFQVVDQAKPGPKADLTGVNMAARVNDGDQIMIPRVGQLPANQATAASINGGIGLAGSSTRGGLLNINTASAEELDGRLPGIGPSLAQRIIEYRSEKGRFNSIEELKEVSGIGDKRFADIKDLICV